MCLKFTGKSTRERAGQKELHRSAEFPLKSSNWLWIRKDEAGKEPWKEARRTIPRAHTGSRITKKKYNRALGRVLRIVLPQSLGQN